MLPELLQNADDAGATRVSFILDEREHSSSRLGGLGADVATLQGPALLQFDDAVILIFSVENKMQNIVVIVGSIEANVLVLLKLFIYLCC